MFKHFGPEHYDPRDPAFHDAPGENGAYAIERRFVRWLALQDEETQTRLRDVGPLHWPYCPCKPERKT